MKGRKLHSDRKHTKQNLRQFVKGDDPEADYAIMSMPSDERVRLERVVDKARGGKHGNDKRRRQ